MGKDTSYRTNLPSKNSMSCSLRHIETKGSGHLHKLLRIGSGVKSMSNWELLKVVTKQNARPVNVASNSLTYGCNNLGGRPKKYLAYALLFESKLATGPNDVVRAAYDRLLSIVIRADTRPG